MFGKWLFALVAPLALAATLSACDNGVQPGIQAAPQGGFRGEAGRVVAIRDVDLQNTRRGVSNGTLMGGGLGAVGGAIAGTAIDRNSPTRGIAVTVNKDDGQQVTIAQRDDGDVQMGDRVIIIYDNDGVARTVRDTGRRRDY